MIMMAKQESARGMTSWRLRPRGLAVRRMNEARVGGTFAFYEGEHGTKKEIFLRRINCGEVEENRTLSKPKGYGTQNANKIYWMRAVVRTGE
jgi:hypothetical protein